MHDKNNQPVSGQVSLFQILKLLDDRENALSSRDLSKIIDKLSSVKYKQEIYEAKKRQKEKRERREREIQKAREQKEAHIKKATSMELPLDWKNVFNNDSRTQGIHANSISDGLIYSLSKQNLFQTGMTIRNGASLKTAMSCAIYA